MKVLSQQRSDALGRCPHVIACAYHHLEADRQQHLRCNPFYATRSIATLLTSRPSATRET